MIIHKKTFVENLWKYLANYYLIKKNNAKWKILPLLCFPYVLLTFISSTIIIIYLRGITVSTQTYFAVSIYLLIVRVADIMSCILPACDVTSIYWARSRRPIGSGGWKLQKGWRWAICFQYICTKLIRRHAAITLACIWRFFKIIKLGQKRLTSPVKTLSKKLMHQFLPEKCCIIHKILKDYEHKIIHNIKNILGTFNSSSVFYKVLTKNYKTAKKVNKMIVLKKKTLTELAKATLTSLTFSSLQPSW